MSKQPPRSPSKKPPYAAVKRSRWPFPRISEWPAVPSDRVRRVGQLLLALKPEERRIAIELGNAADEKPWTRPAVTGERQALFVLMCEWLMRGWEHWDERRRKHQIDVVLDELRKIEPRAVFKVPGKRLGVDADQVAALLNGKARPEYARRRVETGAALAKEIARSAEIWTKSSVASIEKAYRKRYF